MKHSILTVIVVVALAGVTAAFTYRAAGDREVKAAMSNGDALAWLRVEFNLDDSQFEQIKQLHDAYSSVCEEHCRAIQRAARVRNELKADPDADAQVVAEAETRLAALRLECETAIAAHVRQCASLMAPAQGERYLALVLPKIRDFDHQAAPTLDVSGHAH